jgi:hypothetical protein
VDSASGQVPIPEPVILSVCSQIVSIHFDALPHAAIHVRRLGTLCQIRRLHYLKRQAKILSSTAGLRTAAPSKAAATT